MVLNDLWKNLGTEEKDHYNNGIWEYQAKLKKTSFNGERKTWIRLVQTF